ncbi:MAG: hypothetical protein K2W95_31330 [Candidatus Obscuribacterales bacterium]|nr:hypothetical protein [Candidatus Obscuribacterales bacterium]
MIKSAPILAIAALLTCSAPAVLAQGCDLSGSPINTLRTPLIQGATNTPPNVQAPVGQPPAIGDGSMPAPVNPGHLGPATLVPSQSYMPGGIGSQEYYLPYNPASVHAPGSFGPSQWVPPPASTPGGDYGNFSGPRDFRPPPVGIGTVGPAGGIIGGAPTQKWGGQTSRDFGRYKHEGTRRYDFGQGMPGQTSQDGPWQGRPGAVPTQDLYGRRSSPSNGSGIMTFAPY